MKFLSFAKMFGNRDTRKGVGRARAGRQRLSEKNRRPFLHVETLEDRNLMAVLPVPNIVAHYDITAGTQLDTLPTSSFPTSTQRGDDSHTVVAIDPVNPQKVVAAYVRNDPAHQKEPGLGNTVYVEFAWSNNGGASWNVSPTRNNLRDFTSTAQPRPPLEQSTNVSVAFDRSENFYLLYTQHSVGNTYGVLTLQKYSFTGFLGPSVVFANKQIQGYTGDILWNPALAVDNTLPSFTDPTTGITMTNPNAGNVYIAWSTVDVPPTGAGNFNPNSVVLLTSHDGGNSFTGGAYLNGNLHVGAGNGNNHASVPRIVVSQGTTDGRVSPGQVSVVYDDFGTGEGASPPNDVIRVDRFQTSVFGQTFRNNLGLSAAETGVNTNNGVINDAIDPGNSAPHIPGTTNFPLTVNINQPGFTLSDLDVVLALEHDNLAQLRILLLSPDGVSHTLVNNRIDTAGNEVQTDQIGMQGNDMGTTGGAPDFPTPATGQFPTPGEYPGTEFDDSAARRLVPGDGATAPYVGHFRAEGGSLDAKYGGRDSTAMSGVWTLRIIDMRSDTSTNGAPVQFVYYWGLKVEGGVTGHRFETVAVRTPILGDVNSPYVKSFTGPASPARGIGPAPVIASDNTLGSFSPYQGRLYVAYVGRYPGIAGPPGSVGNTADNTDIFMVYSDDGGVTWSTPIRVNDDLGAKDGFSGADGDPLTPPLIGFTDNNTTTYDVTGHFSGRPQFQPEIAVDPLNGTLVATWYDTRYDASRARSARFIATSIDGGATFGPQTFLNTPGTTLDYTNFAATGLTTFHNGTAFDEIERTFRNLEPIPDSPTTDGTFAYGDRQGLAVYDGRVFAVWSGNLGGGNRGDAHLDMLGAKAFIAQGPRVVTSTMGPVAPQSAERLSDEATLSFNGQTAPDGTPLVNGFVVYFDRPTDPNSFDPSQVTVIYRDANTTGDKPGIPVTNGFTVTPVVDETRIPAGLTPQQQEPYIELQRKFGPSKYLVAFTPQSGVGTYSYTVGGLDPVQGILIRDRIRTPGDIQGEKALPGHAMDQSNNGIPGEVPLDVWAVPNPVNPASSYDGLQQFFKPAFTQDSLPLIVPGPHVVSSHVVNNPVTADNLVLNATTTSIDVTFDRDMDPTTVTAATVLRMMGPSGLIGPNGVIKAKFTITANPNGTDPDPNFPRTYRINFVKTDGTTPLPIELNGTYVVTLASTIKSKNGDALDTNLNAGVDQLRTTPSAGVSAVAFTSTDVPKSIGDPSVKGKITTSTINVTDDFNVQQGTTVSVNINYPFDPDLTAVLIAPNGTQIKLFEKVGTNGTQANFTNTVFDDRPTDNDGNQILPISQGSPPFTGRFHPQQPLSDLLANGPIRSGGVWTLQITDSASGRVGQLTGWSLTLVKPRPLTGLGEPIADQASVSFRVFTMDPTNPLSRSTWTSVGPSSTTTPPAQPGQAPSVNDHSGRIGGIAVDPSDPSGNTVYVAGASGGVWKTTNFLTTDSRGPTYIPLTDFGPTFGINIGSLTVFGRNNDPTQSIVVAGTGEGDTGSTGAGFLLSRDGGATWTLLDSSTNVDNTGKPLPFSSSQRDHVFQTNSTFKVVVDPRPTPSGDVIIYAAMSGGNGGIWRSLDTGKHWTRVRAGQATDVVLDPNSGRINAVSNPTGNLDVLFGAFRGDGIYISPNRGQVWNLMTGQVGNPLIQDGDFFPTQPIPVSQGQLPQGAKGRIVLAKPDLTGVYLPDGTYTGNPLKDLLYEGWLYAAVVTTGGNVDGLYVTKDFGQNWTRIRVPTLPPRGGANLPQAVPNNDTTQADYDVGGAGNFTQGNYDIAIGVDPTNPNVVYLGGTNDGQPTGVLRVDITGLRDPHAFYLSNTNNDGGVVRINTAAPVNLKGWLNYTGAYINPMDYGVSNLIRSPFSPFNDAATTFVSNTTSFTNTGMGATWTPFDLEGTDHHKWVVTRDPLTGHARLIFGDDQGVYSAVDNNGTFDDGIGTAVAPDFSRNGNLQITQFYYGASQPSSAAAQLGQALFYGMAQDDGFPASDPNILDNGNITWVGVEGDGTGVATDQTGKGTLYQYMWPCCGTGASVTDFFQVNGVSRTFGLIQQSGGGLVPDPQWPFLGGSNFAVNPIQGDQIIMSSQVGRIFGTSNRGQTWLEIGNPGALDNTYGRAPAFGSPQPDDPTGALNDFLYVGTEGGHIFVTFTGGGANGNQWTDISAGLDGSSVRAIVTNPTRGSREAYAVTLRGVYHMVDSRAAGATWQNITGNLFNITHNFFNPDNADSTPLADTQLRYLEAIQADWRYAIPDNPAEYNNPKSPPGPTHPVLYVAGEGGVYRFVDAIRGWQLFPNVQDDGPNTATGFVPQDGGMLPNAHVTDLDLALGNINPTTGHPIVLDPSSGAKGPDVLLATTYGRGSFAIRVAPVVVPNSTRLDPTLPAPFGSDSGPNVNDKVTNILVPVIDGMSEQSAFNNTVKVEMYDITNGFSIVGGQVVGAPKIGVDPTNAANAFVFTDQNGRFQIQVKAGYFKADGSTDGFKRIGLLPTDAAGAIGAMSEFDFTLDTTPFIHPTSIKLDPSAPLPAAQGGSDSGLSFTDKVTFVTRPIIDGAVDQAGPTTIQIFDVTNANNIQKVAEGTTDANGNFSLQVFAGIYKTDGSTDGVRVLQVTAPHIPKAGNSVTFTFTLDTTPPGKPSVPNLLPASDSGSSSTDHITNVTKPTFIGTAEPNALVQVFATDSKNNTTLIGQATASANGNYTVTVGPGALADGTYTITAQQTDVAGNVSPVPTSADGMTPPLVIKTTAPAKPSIKLDPAFDTGVQGDNTTAAVPTQFDGTTDPNTSVVVKDNGVVVASFNQGNTSTFTVTLTLSDGTHPLTVESTDLAGNKSVSAPVNITINRDSLDADRKFIRQIYFLALGRTGSLTEWNNWVPLLQQPNGRFMVANAINRSFEARDFVVKQWYLTYFGRQALNGEERSWAQAMVNGATEEQILVLFLASPEYYNHAPAIPGVGGGAPSDTNFVKALYIQLLGRQADATGINYWVGQVAQFGRQNVAGRFLLSPEYRSNQVVSYYLNILRRSTPPGASEVAGWVNSGLDLLRIRILFESSNEFYFRVTGLNP